MLVEIHNSQVILWTLTLRMIKKVNNNICVLITQCKMRPILHVLCEVCIDYTKSNSYLNMCWMMGFRPGYRWSDVILGNKQGWTLQPQNHVAGPDCRFVGPGCKLKHFTEWTWGNDEISVRATATGVLVSMCVCLLTWTQNRNTSRDFHPHRYMNLSLHLLVLLVHRQTLRFS